ncbi:MAG: DUF1634 domain-containing protein [Firmicutes bacterium]|nr:DUF1634 domain-containing protein [Bacillota bacterium]
MAVAQKEIKPGTEVTPEQLLYANIINIGMILGMVLLVISFFLYVTGIVPPLIPVEQVPSLWGGKAKEFVAVSHVHGWKWLGYIGKGDYMNFIGIALLSLLTILGYLVLLPAYIRRKDTAYALLVTAEIVVLVLAATGILNAGAH